MARNKLTMQQQAQKLLEQAEKRGLTSNFFFATTFKRYRVQMETLEELEKAIKEYGSTVTKEYVKGRQNIVINPAITEYNKTVTSANGTVSTLITILKTLDETKEQSNSLMSLLSDDEKGADNGRT